MRRNIAELDSLLGYSFQDKSLLATALTHRSVTDDNNERLEFLGDSILNCTITAELFQRYPDTQEGELSRLRASLVNRDSLAAISKTLELGDFVILGSGELKSGGSRRKSILADTLEAIFGAIYLDSDYQTAVRIILSLYQDRFNNPVALDGLKDPKTRLQEYLQARKQALPEYRLLDTTGKPHAQTFIIECLLADLALNTRSTGSSRRIAEQKAAEKMLQILLAQNDS